MGYYLAYFFFDHIEHILGQRITVVAGALAWITFGAFVELLQKICNDLVQLGAANMLDDAVAHKVFLMASKQSLFRLRRHLPVSDLRVRRRCIGIHFLDGIYAVFNTHWTVRPAHLVQYSLIPLIVTLLHRLTATVTPHQLMITSSRTVRFTGISSDALSLVSELLEHTFQEKR